MDRLWDLVLEEVFSGMDLPEVLLYFLASKDDFLELLSPVNCIEEIPFLNALNADFTLSPVFCALLMGEKPLFSPVITFFILEPILRVKLPPVEVASKDSAEDRDDATDFLDRDRERPSSDG